MSEHAYLYDRRWRKRREQQLRDHPLCARCVEMGIVKAARIADHVTPHRGDPALFEGPLQSLCKECHDSAKQSQEKGGDGYVRGSDANGMPRDPRHPWFRGT